MEFILQILLLLIVAKIFGELVEQAGYSSLIGEIAAGIVLGPSLLNLVSPSSTLELFADIGLIALIFISGVDTNFRSFVRSERIAAPTAIAGVAVPFAGGYLLGIVADLAFLETLFLAIALTATSIGISVRTLIDFKKINTRVGATIVGAAVFDDVIGIILLGVLSAFATNQMFVNSLLSTILWGLVFLIGMAVIGKRFIIWLFEKARRTQTHEMMYSITIIIAITVAYISYISGLHFAIGAFIAGIILGDQVRTDRILFDSLNDFGFGFFITIFFASIGLLFDFSVGTLFSPLIIPVIVVALAGKIIGGFIGSSHFLRVGEALTVGIGLCPRGEIGLVIAKLALVSGIISTGLYSAFTVMVIVSILATPMLMKYSFARLEGAVTGPPVKTEMK